MKPWIFPFAIALVAAGSVTAADAQFTCSTVARAGQLDPDGLVYGNVFREEVGVNASGDAVFVARASGARDKLYFYPGAGAGEVVARADGPAPGGGTFRSQRAFSFLSVNDADDVGFLGQLVAGEGVFVRDGGALESAALRSQASPGGGVFAGFRTVGDIDAASRVPFVATVDGGPGGAFVYASATDGLTTLVLDEAATLDGREICTTQAVDLGDSGRATIRAISKVDCSNAAESAVSGIFLVTGGGISTVALAGDAAPLGGSTFAKFVETPLINSGDDIAFRATTAGTTKTDGIFTWDFATDTFATAVRKGDAAPVVGGSFSAIRSFDFADGGNVLLNANLKTSAAKFGVFDLGVVDAPAVVKTDAPPTDAFGVGASYTRFSKVNGASSDGERIGLQVRVRDSVPPAAKVGVIRCAGSPSGAFVDGESFF